MEASTAWEVEGLDADRPARRLDRGPGLIAVLGAEDDKRSGRLFGRIGLESEGDPAARHVGVVRSVRRGRPAERLLEESKNNARMDSPVVPRLRQVVIDAADARATAEFWRQLLGLVYRPEHEPPPAGEDDPAGGDWLNLRDPDGTPCLAFQQVDSLTPSTWPDHAVPQQLHLDLSVGSVDELAAVHQRVLAIGGVLRLDRSADPDEPLYVYADPAGHPFCVFVADG